MKKLFALFACAGLLAACGQKPAPATAPVATSEAAAASDTASAPKVNEQSITAKPATYDPNLKPATTAVTVNLGASH